MRKNRREVLSTLIVSAHEPSKDENESHHDSRGEEEEEEEEEEEVRRPRKRGRVKQQATDFRVEIPEFEGQLNPDDFLN